MKLKSLRIRNLGPYQETDLDFSSTDTGLVFVNGNNGRGKTTFLNSLKWCLFGGERPKVSTPTIASRGVAKPIEVRVEIEVEDDTGQVLVLEKSQLVTVMDDLVTERNVAPATLTGKLRSADKPTQDIPDASLAVQEWFPRKLEDFILFDAEDLAGFFTSETRQAIEEAVNQIAGVDDLDYAITLIGEQAKKFRASLSNLGGTEVEKLNELLEGCIEARTNAQKELDEVGTNRSEAEISLRDTRRELAKYDLAQERLEEVDSLRAEVDALSEEITRQETLLNQTVLHHGHLFAVAESIEGVDLFYAEGLEAGYPLAFASESLRQILESDKCVCGCNLDETDHRKNIEELIAQQAVAEGVDKSLPETKTVALGLLTSLSQTKSLLVTTNQSIVQLGKQYERKLQELKKLEQNAPSSSDWSSLELEERRLNARVDSAKRIEREKSRELAELKPKIQKLEASIAAAVTNDEQSVRLQKVLNFVVQSLETAQETRKLAIEKVRLNLESAMNEQYSSIKSGTYVVQVSKSFEVQLTNQDTQSISEGERMSLAYAFAIAIRTSLGMQFPLVIDSAFGKLDSSNRNWLAQSLVKLVKEDKRRQAIFLMHDLEYTPDTAKVFSAAAPREFYLDHDAETKVTEIRVGVDPSWLSSPTSPWYKH